MRCAYSSTGKRLPHSFLFSGQTKLVVYVQVVAEARSSEAFVALCLLTVAGTSLLTQKLGFSDTVRHIFSQRECLRCMPVIFLNSYFHMQLGAFLAGALLAETNFRTQIEADIRPFRGLLLGLFFVTTGSSIDMQVIT